MLPDIYGLEADQRAQQRPMGVTLITTLLGLEGFVVTLTGVARLIAWFTGRLQLLKQRIDRSLTLSTTDS